MSKESWLKAFYPKPAEKGLTNLEQLDQDILKWSGCNASSLRAHGVTFYGGVVRYQGETVLHFMGITCASCVASMNCRICPIPIYSEDNCGVNFEEAIKTGEVGPILKQLRQARRNLLKELKTRDE